MKTNTITTVKLESDEGSILIHKTNRLIYGKIFFCPVSDMNNYEEMTEAEAKPLIEAAEEEERLRIELEEQESQATEEVQADGSNNN